MKKIRKFLFTLVVMFFLPILITSCGEVKITKITPEAGSILTSWEVGRTYDYSSIKLKVTYSDGTTKTITPNTEGVQIINIDTTTSGEKKLKIKFGEFESEIKIMVYDNADQAYTIAGFEAPTFVADHFARKSVNSAEDSGFLIHNDTYYVGDDNEFIFLPNITVYKDASINAIPQKLNKYKSNVKVELKNGSQYIELTSTSTPSLAQMVEIDNVNSEFDFTQDAVNKTFKITVSPYYSEPEDDIDPITFEFMVKDGFNVYDERQLSVLDNNPFTKRVWADKKEEWGIPTDYNPAGVYLHADLNLEPEHFPETFFINEEEAGANTDNALGSLKQRTSLYTFNSARNASEFEFCGNYFTVNASAIPQTVRDCRDESGRTEFYREPYVNEMGLPIQGHASLLSLGGDNVQYSNKDNGESPIEYVGSVKIKNITFTGNAHKNNSSDFQGTGGMQMIITGAKTLTTENIIAQQFVLATNALGNWEATGTQQDDNNGLTNDNNVVVRNSKYQDTYTTMFYCWGSEVSVYDSILKNAGGPIFMAVHYGDEVNRKYPNINVYDSEATSYVTGQEAWFGAYGATTVATDLLAVARAVKDNADGIESATGTTFEKNSMTRPKAGGTEEWNFIGLIMQADIMDLSKSETRGSINLYETKNSDYTLVGSLNAYTTGDNANPQYAQYATNPQLEATKASPLFQSFVNGAPSTMVSLIDENSGTLGIYGQSFIDCINETPTTQYFGLTAADVANFYSGEYLSVFVPGTDSTCDRMGCLVTYQRVDS